MECWKLTALLVALALLARCGSGGSEGIAREDTGEDAVSDAAGEEDAPETAAELDEAAAVDAELDAADPGGVETEMQAGETDADSGILPGQPGYPCSVDAECSSGYCIHTPDGRQCTMQCEEECPFGWACLVLAESLPDAVYICTPAFMGLCRPCTVDADCGVNGVAGGDLCVPYGPAGSFCGAACESTACPDGYACQDIEVSQSTVVKQCVRTGDECPCNDLFASQGAATKCAVVNDWGSCSGERHCTADGLTACSADVPAAETCNAMDDDCDDKVDEGTGGAPCTVTNELGTCSGTTLCINGEETCGAAEAEPEACDGTDNDCDAAVDEEYPDTDGDGTADCMETDKDGDGILDGLDNCPLAANPQQEDFDLDTVGDACDPDDDNDLDPDTLDCAVNDPLIHHAAPEACNASDDDCDGSIDEDYPDADLDGLPDCLDDDSDGDGDPNLTDCGPLDPAIHHAAAELCNGLDDDCNGKLDDGFAPLECGLGNCHHFAPSCAGGEAGMCDPLAGAAPETCDGLDNDCDGSADEGFGILECGLGECKHSIPMCLEGKPQACDPTAGATAEWCDGKDNDCNGIADETFPLGLACAVGVGECTAVGLTVCAPGGKSTTCSVVPLPPAQDLCDGLDNDCDGLADEDFQLGKPCIVGSGTCTALGVTVCDQSKTATVCGAAPGTPAEEKCDGKDNDCNGKADDPFPLNKPCTAGIGECKTLGTTTCAADGDGVECNAIPGDPANELCDGKDNDCDGKTDETWPTLGTACAAGMGECKDWGVMACTANHQAAYCTADPNPSQDETCDGKDNDCDGKTDEEWPDLGKPCTEGLGECKDNGVVACTKDGLASECTANPALPEDETCDGKDNDCDGKADEEWPNLGKLCFAGEGICKTAGIFLCFEGDAVCSAMPGNPADEICDGLDNDCNGSADELWPELYQPCSQGTGECAAQGVFVCAPGGTVCTAKPGNPAAETCDGKDNDCDGQTDEDTATVCQVCNGPQGLTNLPKDTPCGNGKLCDGNGQCIDNCSLAATGLYKSCYEIHQACPQLPTGSYKITPQAAGIDVTCNMTDSDGGWTRMTGQYLATLGNTTREYLYLKDGAWYRSPPTTLVWSWATYTVLEGTYAYGGVNGAGSFPCSHNEQGFWGVGCSNGGGHQWKCFVHGQGNKDTVNGRTSICQDIPDVFQVGACAPWVEIYVRP